MQVVARPGPADDAHRARAASARRASRSRSRPARSTTSPAARTSSTWLADHGEQPRPGRDRRGARRAGAPGRRPARPGRRAARRRAADAARDRQRRARARRGPGARRSCSSAPSPSRILATSREPLRLRTERELPLGPLPVESGVDAVPRTRAGRPTRRRARPHGRRGGRRAARGAAALDRARGAARPRPDARGAPRAARDPAVVLAGGYADAPERHRALRATLDWSYDLLGEGDRRAFARLGVFVGGFRLEAAAAVLGQDEVEAADRVASLVDKSLVAPQGAGAAPRYLMLETIREYALEQLDARDELEDAASRHALHFTELAESSEQELLGDDRAAWVRSLSDDHPNFRAALEWTLALPDPGHGAAARRRALAVLARPRRPRRRPRVARAGARLPRRRAFGLPGQGARRSGRARGGLRRRRRGPDACRGARRARPPIDDDAQLASALTSFANVLSDDGALEEAAVPVRRGCGCRRAGRRHRAAVGVITNLGYLALRLGEWDRAAAESRRALDRSRAVGDSAGVVVSLVNLGFASIHLELPDDAASAFVEALAFLRDLEDRESIAYCLDGIGEVLAGRGLDSDALRLAAAAAAMREAIGASLPPYERDLHERVVERDARARLGADAARGRGGRCARCRRRTRSSRHSRSRARTPRRAPLDSSAAWPESGCKIDVRPRTEFGSAASRRLRREGFVPGVLYGRQEPASFVVAERELRRVLTGAGGLHAILDIAIDGGATQPAILKDYQQDPVKGKLLHIDLQEVRLDQPITASVVVSLVGGEDAPGVREGGVLSQIIARGERLRAAARGAGAHRRRRLRDGDRRHAAPRRGADGRRRHLPRRSGRDRARDDHRPDPRGRARGRGRGGRGGRGGVEGEAAPEGAAGRGSGATRAPASPTTTEG